MTFLWIATLLFFAKVGSLADRIGQPVVLGELLIGVVLGNLALVGIHWFEPIVHDEIIRFLAELGVVILLFQIGLESHVSQMRRVGVASAMVGIVGVVFPFVLGTYLVGPWLLPGLSMSAYLFLGASLTATSVGITARVFKDLGRLQLKEAQIVLGAAVIDDVLGLVILAVISAIVTVGAVSFGMVSIILAKAVLFLVGAILVSHLLAPWIGAGFARLQSSEGMKFAVAIMFCLLLAYLAEHIGLAPIIGAFAAGLVLDHVHFRDFKDPTIVEDLRTALKDHHERNETISYIEEVIDDHSDRHVEDLIEPVAYLLVPLFFVLTGMEVSLAALGDRSILLVALAISLVAIGGKYIAGWFAGRGVNRNLIGFGMVPRGEVGLIFASIGKGLGVISDEVFSVIIIMVIVTTFVTPPILSRILKRA